MAKTAQRITLEEWEQKTRLSQDMKQSVCEIQEACNELPLPFHRFPGERTTASPIIRNLSSGLSTPDSLPGIPTPLNAGLLSSHLYSLSPSRSRSTTNLLAESNEAESAAGKRSALEIGSDKPIETLQQLFDWFSIKESEMKKDEEDVYRNYVSTITLYQKACDDFVNCIRATGELFDDLKRNYEFIEKQTQPLQSACQTLLSEQEQLTELANGLAGQLAYFNHLEPISKLFNSPGEDICRRPEFVSMLETLDSCIQHVQEHLHYRDAELYLMRFRQCMTRGMTLINMYAIKSIKELGDELKRQAASKSVEYVKFNSLAPMIYPLLAQISKRGEGHAEYQQLYADVVYCYTRTRQQLQSPVVNQKVKELNASCEDLLTFVKQLCAYMKSLSSNEINLFDKFFQPGNDKELCAYLDRLANLNSNVFSRIKRERDVSVLTELCDVLQIYISQKNAYYEQDPKHVRIDELFGGLIAKLWEDTQHQLQRHSPSTERASPSSSFFSMK